MANRIQQIDDNSSKSGFYADLPQTPRTCRSRIAIADARSGRRNLFLHVILFHFILHHAVFGHAVLFLHGIVFFTHGILAHAVLSSLPIASLDMESLPMVLLMASLLMLVGGVSARYRRQHQTASRADSDFSCDSPVVEMAKMPDSATV